MFTLNRKLLTLFIHGVYNVYHRANKMCTPLGNGGSLKRVVASFVVCFSDVQVNALVVKKCNVRTEWGVWFEQRLLD